MPAQHYSQYFNIDEKYYAVVTKDLIDKGVVKWEGFYPHDTFVQLLHQTVAMLSGKEDKSIWVEGSYGTGKSHASLTLKCLLEAPEQAVRDYFEDYGLNMDLCNKFLAARSESMHGKLVVVHRIGSSNVRNDDDLVWAVQSSVQEALQNAGITNQAAGTMKEAFVDWTKKVSFAKAALNDILAKNAFKFNNMNADQLLQALQSDDDEVIDELMTELVPLCKENGINCLDMDPEKLAKWLESVIAVNNLGGIVFIWDEFSEFFKNCQNSLTGFQTLAQVSHSVPFYFVIVTHNSDGLIQNYADRSKISNRFIEPRISIELPDNMAFRLMAQAMKETSDEVMRAEWHKLKPALNNKLGAVRKTITDGAQKHSKAGVKTQLSDEQLQEIVPLHPYAALILKHISKLFTASQRSMFDFIIARDPEADGAQNDENVLVCRGFKWFINHHGALQQDNLMTVDMLWDFFNTKAGGNMNADALTILNNYDMLTSEFKLNPDEQRVLKTVLLMNAICTRVAEADMLTPTYENIDLAFKGTSWSTGKASNIARAMVHRPAPLQPVLFEEPASDGHMRVIPIQKRGGDDINPIKERVRQATTASTLVESGELPSKMKVPVNLDGHFTTSFAYVNVQSSLTFTNGIKEAKNRAVANPNHFELVVVVAMTDAERAAAGSAIQNLLRNGIPENLLILDGTTNTFETYLDSYITHTAYSEYYLKSDKKQSSQFAANAKKQLTTWAEQLINGQFRLFDSNHPNGQMRTNFEAMTSLLQEINLQKYPYGIEQFNVLPTMFAKMALGQGAECGITETEKGSFSSSQPKTRLSTAIGSAWKSNGSYWEEPANQGLIITQVKKKVEEIIATGFEKNGGRVDIIDIYTELRNPPFGMTATNLTAFVLGFVLKEYANEQYFWSNGTTRPMSVELMKTAIKNALDQSTNPKASYRPEAIVTMGTERREFLQGTATIFHESLEHCGSVDAAAGVIRLGMKRLEFPIWCVKSILDVEKTATDTGVLAEIIDKYLGIANIKNYPEKTTESDLATEIGGMMSHYPSLVTDLTALLNSAKCRDGMRAYLKQYRGGELPALAEKIKDSGNYISEVKKRFNADEANWVWSAETANAKIDDVILDYSIIAESNTVIAPAMSVVGCIRNWKDRVQNFRISFDAMESELGDRVELREFMEILNDMKKSASPAFPEMKKARFLDLLRSQKDNFKQLYNHQPETFRKIAAGWLNEIGSDQEIEELFEQIDTGVFTDSSEKYFKMVEAKITAFMDASRKRRLENMWFAKTNTVSPKAWSAQFNTPILCMFSDNDRQEAKEIFAIFSKSAPTSAEFERAMVYIENGTFYGSLESMEERDRCMKDRLIGDYIYMISDVNEVRKYLRNYASMVEPYDWMDNSIIRNKIVELADKQYKTGGASKAQAAIDDLNPDDVRAYLKDLIKTNMAVGIAIMKKRPQ